MLEWLLKPVWREVKNRRKYVWLKTQVRFRSNAKEFWLKRTCAWGKTQRRFFQMSLCFFKGNNLTWFLLVVKIKKGSLNFSLNVHFFSSLVLLWTILLYFLWLIFLIKTHTHPRTIFGIVWLLMGMIGEFWTFWESWKCI